MRQKYDTFVVYLFIQGKEKLLPEEFRKTIPASTVHTWRQYTDLRSYIGHQFTCGQDEFFLRETILLENKQLKSLIYALIKTWVLLKDAGLFFPPNVKREEIITEAIQFLKQFIPLPTCCHLFQISISTYHRWIFNSKHRCIESLNSLCFKRHKNQLSIKEVQIIKKYLALQEIQHWPVCSIAYYTLKNKIVSVSLNTWYKYAKMLGYKRKLQPKKYKRIGLRANYPNEYWHVDTTQYELDNGEVTYISFVIDNFSKLILGYHIGLRNSWENVQKALQKAIDLSNAVYSKQKINLVADGGHENHHPNVVAFLKDLKNVDIHILRALKDITYSNSAVEATHRTIKGFYLNQLSFNSIEKLNEYLNNFVLKDFNELRPHCSLKGLTPYEKYTNPQQILSFSNYFSLARQQRIEENGKFNCSICK